MKASSIKAVFRCLHEADIRYIVVGGLAVIEHGFLRQTKDIDLVIELEPANITCGLVALQRLGYFPVFPFALKISRAPICANNGSATRGCLC